MNYWAVIVAAVAAFALSSVYYSVFGQQMIKLHATNPGAAAAMAKPPPWKLPVEVSRSLTLAYVLALLVVRLGIGDWKGAVQLGLLLWIGFPFVLWVGAILWENVSLKLAAIHAGDWLAKIVLIEVILGVWRRSTP